MFASPTSIKFVTLLKLPIGCRAWRLVARPAALRHSRADPGTRKS